MMVPCGTSTCRRTTTSAFHCRCGSSGGWALLQGAGADATPVTGADPERLGWLEDAQLLLALEVAGDLVDVLAQRLRLRYLANGAPLAQDRTGNRSVVLRPVVASMKSTSGAI
jgi:hypothetical protein